jgi:hypothetical protein
LQTYKERDIESIPNEIKLGNHSLDTSIADIDTVQKGHHVYHKEGREYDKVEFPNQPTLGLGIDWAIRGVFAAFLRRLRDSLLTRLNGHLLIERRHSVSFVVTQMRQYGWSQSRW